MSGRARAGLWTIAAIAVLAVTAGAQGPFQRMRERRQARKAAAEAVPASGLVTRITTLKEGGARLDWVDSKIAFDMLGPGGAFAVYVMKPDGSDTRCLTCDNPALPKQRNIGQPAWDPSGRYLVFQVEKAQHPHVAFEHALEPGAGVMNDLWVLDTQTSRATMVRQVGDAPGQGTLHPHFSSDGTMLSWSEMQAKAGLRKSQELGYWQLMIADFRTDRGGPRLENVNSVTPGGPGFYENHGFSSDGSRLIFTSNFEAQRRFTADIYTLEMRGRKLTRLTSEGYNEHAIYSPDGRSIAWISNVGNPRGGTDYWIMNSDGSNKRRLTSFTLKGSPEYVGTKVVVADLSWRPDGTAFAGYYREGGAIESKRHPTKIILVELRLR